MTFAASRHRTVSPSARTPLALPISNSFAFPAMARLAGRSREQILDLVVAAARRLAGGRHVRVARRRHPVTWTRAGSDAHDLHLTRPVSVGLQEARRRSSGRALSRANGVASHREPEDRK